MITRDDLQSWLERLDGGSLTVDEVEPNLWICRTADETEARVQAWLDRKESSTPWD